MSVLGKKIADLKGNVTGLNFSPEKNTATVEETDVGMFGTVIMTVTFWPPVAVSYTHLTLPTIYSV